MRMCLVRSGAGWTFVLGLIALGLLAAAAPGQALEPSYLAEMPEPRRVLANIQGRDRLDTLARQMAAMSILRKLVDEMAGTRYYAGGTFPMPDEKRIADRYAAESVRLQNEAFASFDPAAKGPDTPRRKWEAQRYAYARDPQFRAALLEQYFSPQFRARLEATVADLKQRVQRHQAQQRRAGERLAGRRESNWDRMGPSEREGAITAAVLTLLLLGLSAVRELRRSGFVGADFSRYRVGFRRYRIEWITGPIANYEAVKDIHGTLKEEYNPATHETKRVGTVYATLQEKFEITGERDSGAHEVRYVDVTKKHPETHGAGSFAAHVGHRTTAVWATRRGRKTGYYIAFRDWAASRDIDHPATGVALRTILGARWWSLLPALGLGLVIGSATDVLAGLLPGLSGRGHGLIMALLVAVLWGILLARFSAGRQARFAERELPRLWAHLAPRVARAPESPPLA